MTRARPAADLFSWRLRTQHIVGPKAAAPEDVVEKLGAVQSQDFAGAKWSLGQRIRGGTDAIVEAAVADGRILRTHVLRPTWHFVSPADIRWMLQLTGPRILKLNAGVCRQVELDATVFKRTHTIITGALLGGTHLTRAEIAAALRRAGIKAATLRLAYIMMEAELTGLVCSGAPRGKQQTYALLEERVAPARARSRDEALAELVRRFLSGHGPATLKHFAWWSGLTLADAKAGLAMVRRHLDHDVFDGHEFWFADGPPRESRSQSAHLIPEYDEALVGSRELGVRDLPRDRPGKPWNDRFLRPVIIGGRRAGTWKRTMDKKRALIELNLFTSIGTTPANALKSAVADYGRFLGMPAVPA